MHSFVQLCASKYQTHDNRAGASTSVQTEGGAPALLWISVQTIPFSPRKRRGQASIGNHKGTLLAPGENRHSGPGENRQFWPDENRQSLFTI